MAAKQISGLCKAEEVTISMSEIDYEHRNWEDQRRRYIKRYMPLFKLSVVGNWKAAKKLIDEDVEIVRASITHGQETVLHIAAGAGHIYFVEQLLEYLSKEDLCKRDAKGNTAFCFAVVAGSVPIAELMIRKNPELPQIRGSEGMTTLYMATLCGHEKMSSFLYPTLIADVDLSERLGIFFNCINNDLFDLALTMLHDYQELAVARDNNNETALHLLARKPSVFAIKKEGIRKRFIHSFTSNRKYFQTPGLELLNYLWETVIWQNNWLLFDVLREPSHVLFLATKTGNFEFVAELLRVYPELVWEKDENNRSLFHIAAMFHHTNFFNLIHELGLYKDFIVSFKDNESNNILHLAAKLAPANQLCAVPGPALKIQRELLWFEEVKKIAPPSYLDMKNSEDKSPRDVFTEEHEGLMLKGESWIKSVASSCMFASILIAISVFVGAVNVVTNDRNTDNGVTLSLCVVSGILASFYSSIAILVSSSILSSRFEEKDFFISLPLKLIILVGSVYLSTTALMVSYGTALYIEYHQRLKWIPILISILAFVLVCCCISLHYPLVSYALRSTYSSWATLRKTHRF